ncbi:hypothetical protein IV102_23630 [bacterium]|nr:hypothetical protein [bacterium]
MRIVRGNQSGLVIPLIERSYVMGRAIGHEDVGPGRIYFHDPSVALLQARLRWDEGLQEYAISQETSSSRSSVSGLPLTRGATLSLKRGSRLKLGNLVLLVEDASSPVPGVASERPPKPEPQRPAAPPDSGEDTVEAVPLVQAQRVDATWFRVKLYTLRPTDVLHGPVAELFEDGQLKRLAVYHQGTVSTSHNQLLLEAGDPVGRVFSDFSECVYSGGQETVMTHIDGEVDLFEEEVEWQVWVQKWIDQICGNQSVGVLPTPVQTPKV